MQSEVSAFDDSRLRFAIWFIAISGSLFLIYCFPYAEIGLPTAWFHAYLAAYARLAGGLISLFDRSVVVVGADILGRYPLRIVETCDAMEVNILFAAAVLAFPSAWPRRLLVLAVGLPLLVAVNVLRICSLYGVGLVEPSAVEVLHMDVWPLLMIAAAAGLFFAAAMFLRASEAR